MRRDWRSMPRSSNCTARSGRPAPRGSGSLRNVAPNRYAGISCGSSVVARSSRGHRAFQIRILSQLFPAVILHGARPVNIRQPASRTHPPGFHQLRRAHQYFVLFLCMASRATLIFRCSRHTPAKPTGSNSNSSQAAAFPLFTSNPYAKKSPPPRSTPSRSTAPCIACCAA